MANILIVEEDLNYSRKIINILSKTNDEFKLCGLAINAEETLSFIQNYTIDIILIDLKIIEKINPKHLKKFKNSIILITENTVISNSYLIYDSISKNDNIDILNNKIAKLLMKTSQFDNSKTFKNLINHELTYLGYKTSYKGFQYLLETIYLLHNSQDFYKDNLSKDIYPIIAEKFHTTPLNVKYNIRNATEIMYYDCSENRLSKYLGCDVSNIPKTKTIIYAIENHIRKKIS